MIDFYREFPDAWASSKYYLHQPRQARGAENIILNTSLSFTPNRREQNNQKGTFLNVKVKGMPLAGKRSSPYLIRLLTESCTRYSARGSVYSRYKKAVRINSKKPNDRQKEITIPVLKKPVCIWNNQNYSFIDGFLSFPVIVSGKSHRISVKTLTTDYQLQYLHYKLGSLRITQKSNKWVAQISVCVPEENAKGNNSMGVDLGLKVPAVAVTESGKTKFAGNGRQNKYIKRKHRAKRKKLGESKKLKAIKNLNDKEQRWMKDQDHKTSRSIVNFANINNVSVIRIEKLANIRNTARTSRKNEKSLHTWSFYRLTQFIEYKARLAGINVEYINPKHTSQKCPDCGTLNKAKDRKYQCSCGFKTHRDRLGAINIINAPVADGNSLSA